MARRREAQKRETTPDSRFHDKDVSLFINLMMRDGKKSVSENIFYATLEAIKVKLHVNDEQSLEVFKKALGNVMPQIEVKSRRVGGATYQVSRTETATISETNGGRYLWEIIDDTQDANWQNITNVQSSGWTQVSDTQDAGWTQIDTN